MLPALIKSGLRARRISGGVTASTEVPSLWL